jgi:putative ABC transport system permease protein
VITLTLSLGIGITSAVFAMFNAVLIKPLPYKNPDSLVMIWKRIPQFNIIRGEFSLPEFNDLFGQTHSFEGMAAFSSSSFNLTGFGDPIRCSGLSVTYDFFSVIGVDPAAGRWFMPTESQSERSNVIVISHKLWVEQFGAGLDVLGRMIKIDDQGHQIVGILPRGFRLLNKEPDLIAPIPFNQENQNRGLQFLKVLARLKTDVTLNQAQADIGVVASRIERDNPQTNSGVTVAILPLYEQVVGNVKFPLLILLTSALFVLLIAWANVVHLLLAHAISREKEFAIRAALGASQPRILQQLITESLLYATLGGIFGLILASWGLNLLHAVKQIEMPRIEEVDFDTSIILITLIVSLLTGIVCCIASFRKVLKPDLGKLLKDEGNFATFSYRGYRVRTLLAITEVALSIVLLICAMLLIRSFQRLWQNETGFNSSNIVTMQLPLSVRRYSELYQQASLYQQILDRVTALPGIQTGGIASSLPILGVEQYGISIEGRIAQTNNVTIVSRQVVSPGYFRALSIPLLSGRVFTENDNPQFPPVAVISAAMARRFWLAENPVGRKFKMGNVRSNSPWVTIVGVVGDVRQNGLNLESEPQMYIPYFQDPTPDAFLVLKGTSNVNSLMNSVRSAILAVDKDQPIVNVKTMEQILADSVAKQWLSASLLSVFAGLATILTLLGVYSVIAYSVAQRTREIGIRIALGAASPDILMLILRQMFPVVLIGIGIGLACSYTVVQLISNQLYGISATDTVTFLTVPLLVLGGGMIVSLIPAYKAVKTDPAKVIRAG